MRARVLSVVKSAMQRFQANPGQSVVVQMQSNAGEVLQIEGFQPSGLAGVPPAGARAIVLQLGESPNSAVVIALQNYQITLSLAQGEAMLYSTTADGKTLKGQVKVDAAGLIHVQNPSANLLTILTNLVSALTSWTSINCVNGSPVTPNPATVTALNNIVTQLQGLFA